MNQGIHDGLHHGAGFTAPDDQTYVGYWGDLRPIIENDAPGWSSQLMGSNLTLAVPPLIGIGEVCASPWKCVALEIPFDAEAVEFTPVGDFDASGNTVSCTIDIGIGPSGKETVILEGFLLGSRHTTFTAAGQGDTVGPFPVTIPAGSRVAVRVNLSAASNNLVFQNLAVTAHFYRYYFGRSGNRGVTIPAGFPTPPTIPTPGGVDTETAYYSIGNLPFDAYWAVPCPALVQSNNYTATGGWAVDYAYVDLDGTVVPFIENSPGYPTATESQWSLNRPYPVNLPAGTEIQARGRFGATLNASGFVAALTVIGTESIDSGRPIQRYGAVL